MKIFTNKDIDVTIIEINPNIDKLYEFLDIDEYKNKDYKDKSIYILQYPKGLKASLSLGIIKNINKKNIEHFCSTDLGSSGGPILSLSNYKIIGIHKRKTKYKYNEGTFLNM